MPGPGAPRHRAARPSSPRLIARAAFLLVLSTAACGPLPARLRWVSSQATQASWSFVVDDRARGAELLVDGRERQYDCDRAGRTMRCELHGLFPGGHTVELRLPGAVLRRSVVVGHDWPAWPALVRVRDPDDARDAAQAGADGVVADASLGLEALQDIAEAAHAKSARLFVQGDPRAVELAGADGVIGGRVPSEIRTRFPEALELELDAAASNALASPSGADAAPVVTRLRTATGLVEAHGLAAAALAHAAPHGAIVDRQAFPLLAARKRHPALRGATVEPFSTAPARIGLLLRTRGDEVALVINGSTDVWVLTPPAPTDPIDLLGSHIENGTVTLKPGDVALLVRSPTPDRTRF